MSEEERSNLYIYVYSALDDDLIFAETKYTLADLHKLQRENQELKKQLEAKESQQREFIEYLEVPIKIITEGNPTNISEYTAGKLDTLKEILSKYKEIIGEEM